MVRAIEPIVPREPQPVERAVLPAEVGDAEDPVLGKEAAERPQDPARVRDVVESQEGADELEAGFGRGFLANAARRLP
jgi:hypothetical protein